MTEEIFQQVASGALEYLKKVGIHSKPEITAHDFTEGAKYQDPIAEKRGYNLAIYEVLAYMKKRSDYHRQILFQMRDLPEDSIQKFRYSAQVDEIDEEIKELEKMRK
jgi:hypothetical protein